MKTYLRRISAASLAGLLFAVVPARSETLATDKAPAVVAIPAGLNPDLNEQLNQQLALIAALRNTFGGVMEDYNNTPRTGIVVGSSQEARLNSKIVAVNRARAAYIDEVMRFNENIAVAAEELRVIEGMTAYILLSKEWSGEKKARAVAALNQLGSAGDPDATLALARETWHHILTRDPSTGIAADAAAGEGAGFPGMGRQSHEDCAVFALANAAGRPYGLVAVSATDLIRNAEWRSAAERAAPEQAIEHGGLNGGEVLILAETFGQATVVPSSDFANALNGGRPILVNVVPPQGQWEEGHEIVLTKTFKHGGETWFAVMDSNQPPDKLLYLSSRELDVILKEKGVMFQPDTNRTPVLLRDSRD